MSPSAWPVATRRDHERFCVAEGWRRVKDARGRSGTHHITYELDLPDGRTLRTRISHPVDRSDYGPSLWGHVLRDQLDVVEEDFWHLVKNGRAPARGERPAVRTSLPASLVNLLLTTVGLSDVEVSAMSKAEAVERLNRYWTEGS